jgi:hypothetical protein
MPDILPKPKPKQFTKILDMLNTPKQQLINSVLKHM